MRFSPLLQLGKSSHTPLPLYIRKKLSLLIDLFILFVSLKEGFNFEEKLAVVKN